MLHDEDQEVMTGGFSKNWKICCFLFNGNSSQLRGLLGGMAWPANQTQPHLSAATSLAQATVSGAKVADLNEANKILHFAKETADIPLTIRAHGSLSQLRFGFYADASWSMRPDGSSQGGWLLFLASEDPKMEVPEVP